MKIAIVGTGAMGSLFACKLSSHVPTYMVGTWKDQLDFLRQGPLRLIHPDGSESQYKITATQDLEEVPSVDLALVVVKCWQTERAAQYASLLLKRGGVAVTLQNGLGNLEILARVNGTSRVALGVTSEGATMLAPGLVRHAGHGVTHLAQTPTTFKKLLQFADLLNLAGMKYELVDNPDSLVWGKLAVNAGINPLTALLEVPNGYLVQDPQTQSVMMQAAEEAEAVASAQDIALPYVNAAQLTVEVAKATAENISSMLQDIRRGMPTEIDAISGAIMTIGHGLDVETPINTVLYDLVKSKVEGHDWRARITSLSSPLRTRFESLLLKEKSQ